MAEQIKITGEQAEKIYVMCDEITYKGETLYDVIFQKKDLMDDIIKLPAEIRMKCQADLQEMQGTDFDSAKWMAFVGKYPEILKSTQEFDYKIVKFLRMNPVATKKLAKLCSGKDIKDIDEAVEVCQKHIRFLASDSKLPVSEDM